MTVESLAFKLYTLQLERLRLQAIAARQRRDNEHENVEKTLVASAKVVENIAAARATMTPESHRDAQLAAKLHLSAIEMDLLWAAIGATVDPALNPYLRELAGSEARYGMSLALYGAITGVDARTLHALSLRLTQLHPLLRYGLLVAGADGTPSARPLTACPRLAAHLAGDDTIDEAVLRVGGVLEVSQAPYFDVAQQECVDRIARALASREPVVIVIEGPQEIGKRTAAAVAAQRSGRSVIQLDATRLSTGTAGAHELEVAFSALRRECLFADALPLVAQIESLLNERSESSLRPLARLLDETPISVLVTSSMSGLDLGTSRKILRITMKEPDIAARRVLWEQEVGPLADVDVSLLAVRYRLGAGGVRRAASVARMTAGEAPLTTHGLVDGVRNGIAERLGSLAQRTEIKQTWDDLVLSPDTLDQIKALVGRVRHGHLVHEEWGFSTTLPRGIGTAALFSGPPGTGKTMVAGLIARELDLELYQVDLSKVVSKWVGETEKQLAKIFDAAEAGHALILFDEADSLFAKRTEVKSAVDRYANLEVNYLLQRIESFGGVAILTTNLDTSIDPALRRRLAGHVVFYAPEVDDRTKLWRGFMTPGAPKAAGLNFEKLAEEFPDMTGANIRNSVLAAAFLAASEASPITQSHLRRAGRGEYRAMGRVIH